MIITFIGHRNLKKTKELLGLIEKSIVDNIDNSGKNIIYCGEYGDFDEMCREISQKIKRSFENIEIVFISPYFTLSQQIKIREFVESGVYDSAMYPELENVPLKFAINYRNQWMIERADLIIAYVDREYGGAYNSLRFAERKGKRIINLAE